MLKKFFCKHNYIYYNKVPLYPYSCVFPVTEYRFVCKNCGKVLKVTNKEIESTVDYYNEQYKRLRATGKISVKNTNEFTLSRIGNMDICFKSVGANLAIEDYMDKGIDITKLA